MPIRRGYILKEVGKEYMIIPVNNTKVSIEHIYEINETGRDMYKLLCDNKNIDEIVDILSNDYDVSKELLKRDLLEFIEELKKRDIYYD